ncbi:MAG TPA: glucose-6-phosphate dehydrogenase [Gemmatimonadaceae bacterium]|nr:glucose-6-phosphate dehydrogenase [Gemmatimonadaceae bacterium]
MTVTERDAGIIVIFGATGDLAKRKILPALWKLWADGDLPANTAVLGVGRDTALNDQSFQAHARDSATKAGAPAGVAAHWARSCVFYQAVPGSADFPALGERIGVIERERSLPGNRVFYLSLPPNVFPSTVESLGACGLSKSPGWTRLVIEKPFGRDLASARELNALLHRYFNEQQIYRIDHYLGKETVQNLLVFRFANSIFEPLWNRQQVACVRIKVAESIGVGTRAGYYEQAGAVRDMLQNHVVQLFALTAMEAPGDFDATAIRMEKIKALKSARPIVPEDVILGQYDAGAIDGKRVEGYRQEAGVAADSKTETFVALRLEVDNWRWQGVPFLLSTGKRLAERQTEITIRFHRPPVALFASLAAHEFEANVLRLRLQPNEGFVLHIGVKAPGDDFVVTTRSLRFEYAEAFGPLPEAYETLIENIFEGDQTLFVHADEVETAWAMVQPLLDVGEKAPKLHMYPAGSWGPEEAECLVP